MNSRWWRHSACWTTGAAILASCGSEPGPEGARHAPEETALTAAARAPLDPHPVPADPAGSIGPTPDASDRSGRSFHEFRPSRDGFGFVNSFPGDPIRLGGLERLFSDGEGYGLCGGMSLAAADHFIAGTTIPGDTTIPRRGSRLHAYLLDRQLESIGTLGIVGLKFLKWQRLPDATARGTWALTRHELPVIVAELEGGRPVMLGVVYRDRDDGWSPVGNHQVLAYAIDRQSPDVASIAIYDPNFPGRDDVRLRIDLVEMDDGSGGLVPGARTVRIVPGRADRWVRGVFLIPYTPMPPPERR